MPEQAKVQSSRASAPKQTFCNDTLEKHDGQATFMMLLNIEDCRLFDCKVEIDVKLLAPEWAS